MLSSSKMPTTTTTTLTTSSSISLSAAESATVSEISSFDTGKIIDSHVHIWGTNNAEDHEKYPFAQDPPESLRMLDCSAKALVNRFIDDQQQEKQQQEKQQQEQPDGRHDRSKVFGALVVQPINYKFDHSYVADAIQKYPTRLRGMMLHDPSLSSEDAVNRLEELALQGFVGVRFNPYLWPKIQQVSSTIQDQWEPMSTGSGLAVYQRCGELKMPVGIMCFNGLSLHYDDICRLLQLSPDTTMILDHFAFTTLAQPTDTATTSPEFAQLLSLAIFPNVVVKISALFRMKDPTSNYDTIYKERFVPLYNAFGSHRLMYGSDFPFVLEQPEQYNGHNILLSWLSSSQFSDYDRSMILGGTAERIFGAWGTPIVPKTNKKHL